MAVLLGPQRLHSQVPAVDVQLDLLGGTATSTGSTTAIVKTQARVSDWYFKIAGLTVETIDVAGTMQDGVAVADTAMIVIDESTGNDVVPTALGNGSYRIPMLRFPALGKLTFVKSSNSESVRIASVQVFDKPTAL